MSLTTTRSKGCRNDCYTSISIRSTKPRRDVEKTRRIAEKQLEPKAKKRVGELVATVPDLTITFVDRSMRQRGAGVGHHHLRRIQEYNED